MNQNIKHIKAYIKSNRKRNWQRKCYFSCFYFPACHVDLSAAGKSEIRLKAKVKIALICLWLHTVRGKIHTQL